MYNFPPLQKLVPIPITTIIIAMATNRLNTLQYDDDSCTDMSPVCDESFAYKMNHVHRAFLYNCFDEQPVGIEARVVLLMPVGF